jgi:hypothetical protein
MARGLGGDPVVGFTRDTRVIPTFRGFSAARAIAGAAAGHERADHVP